MKSHKGTLQEVLEQIEQDRFIYTNKNGIKVTFQRLNYDFLWYVIYDNKIINYSQYRKDLKEWCDIHLK